MEIVHTAIFLLLLAVGALFGVDALNNAIVQKRLRKQHEADQQVIDAALQGTNRYRAPTSEELDRMKEAAIGKIAFVTREGGKRSFRVVEELDWIYTSHARRSEAEIYLGYQALQLGGNAITKLTRVGYAWEGLAVRVVRSAKAAKASPATNEEARRTCSEEAGITVPDPRGYTSQQRQNERTPDDRTESGA